MDISVVVPVYNESLSLRLLHEQLTRNLKAIGGKYEIIFVDDGSTDDSYQVITELHNQDKHVKAIQFRRNYGKAAGLAAGFHLASGEIVFTLDADLQDDPDEMVKFIEKLDEGYDFITGWKYPRLDPLSKTLPSRLANGTIRLTTGVKVHDMNCGFKAMRKEVAKELNLYGDMHRYIPVMVSWRGFRTTEVKVKHHPRKYGKSKYGAGRLLRGLFDFLTIIFLTRFNRRPLHLFGLFGIFSLALGVLIDSYLTVLWFLGYKIGDRPLLMLGTLLIIIGVQFFSFGLMAEMFNFEMYSREQNYTIRQILD
jgi:glycosyltransferase involved in cell wall biosynthesis